MKIWEDEKQVYIRASMERNTPEQNAALKERLEQIDWSILEHIQRKETGKCRRSRHAETSLKQQDWMQSGQEK